MCQDKYREKEMVRKGNLRNEVDAAEDDDQSEWYIDHS